jgi:putative membrane protein
VRREFGERPASDDNAGSLPRLRKVRSMIANLLVGLVAAIHLYIVVLEMFLWDKPYGRRVFGNSAEFATASKVLAANQGLYNGFLAAGLIWGLSMGAAGQPVQLFFLGCVAVAGLYGAMSVGIKILFVQTVPAALAIGAILLHL